MIVWGSGGNVLDLGAVETRKCEVCEKDRPFKVVLQYRYWGLYWIFNSVTEKKYLLLCDVCQRGWELDARKVEAAMSKSPIPFMHRGGLVVFGAILVGLFILLTVSILLGG